MANRTTLNVSLTPELQRLIDEQIATGHYASASEVVREGLRLIDDRRRRQAVDEIRAKIDEGWREAEAGELLDGEDVFSEMRDKLAERLAKRKAVAPASRKRS